MPSSHEQMKVNSGIQKGYNECITNQLLVQSEVNNLEPIDHREQYEMYKFCESSSEYETEGNQEESSEKMRMKIGMKSVTLQMRKSY